MSSPNPIRRLSLAMGFGREPPPQPLKVEPAAPSTIAAYLASSKAAFLKDSSSPDKAKKWTVVLGNEAGDLDSVASSIAYAWYLSEFQSTPAVALIQIARDDFVLRAENLYALGLAGIQQPADELLTVSDVDSLTPGTTLFLVDQNRLAAQFSTDTTVVGIIDHHEDEGLYTETATTRTIKPCGSCSSLVAASLPPDIPADLAVLLLTAVIIDTNGLKPGGKATDDDLNAASKLVPLTTLSPSSSSIAPDALHDDPFIKDLNEELSTRKSDLTHLSGWDLLRRDYKEYTHPLSWLEGEPSIKAGLSTVPVPLKLWAKKGKLETDSVAWMNHRGLTVLGVLTTFNDTKKNKKGKGSSSSKKAKGAHKREMAWIVIPGNDSTTDAASIAARLFAGLEESKVLDLRTHKKFKIEKSGQLPPAAKGKVYKQGNAGATRKVVAPLVKHILEGGPPAEPEAPTFQAPARL